MSVERARLSILSELLAFPTINQKDWESGWDDKPLAGDLVSLSAAPTSKWYVSWVIDTKRVHGHDHYLLQSIDDGEQCWWTNVGFNIYSRERLAERSRWRWDDKQFQFYDRWVKVCNRNDAYIVLPVAPKFEGNSVYLDVRIRFGLTEFSNRKKFDNWKKLTMKSMEEFYLSCVDLYQNRDKQGA